MLHQNKIDYTMFTPNDTRTSEVISSLALILAGVTGSLVQYFSIHAGSPLTVWATFLALTGAVHLFCATAQEMLRGARVVACYTAGSFWVWLSVIEYQQTHTTVSIALMLLGLSLLYAATLHALLLLQKPRKQHASRT